MKLFKKMKDGGPDSTSTGYWLVEMKQLFSIVLLRFDGKSREVFHTHAFNCISWVIKGQLEETMIDGRKYVYNPSWLPFLTTRKDFHQVSSTAPTSWVISFRGPWFKKWYEWDPKTNETIGLTNGRVITSREVTQK